MQLGLHNGYNAYNKFCFSAEVTVSTVRLTYRETTIQGEVSKWTVAQVKYYA